MDPKSIAENVAANMSLPQETQKWVDAVKALNISKFRRFLKKGRQHLPPKWRGVYKTDDDTITRLMHSIRTEYPYFTRQEKAISANFFVLYNRMRNGESPLELFKRRHK